MFKYNTIDEALTALKSGKLIICSDDEDRENEGDLICSAEFATPENINFMAKNAKGLICMPMNKEYADKLGLQAMVNNNTDNHQTAFLTSIDYVSTSTGISAFERSITAMSSVNPKVKASDFRHPGHMFPLLSKPYGVLERAGHTEATVDLLLLAGLKPCGLCCEIMSDDGHMMKKDELQKKAKEWNLVFITISDLKKYLKQNGNYISKEASASLPTKYGDFIIYGYKNIINGEHHVALVKGNVQNKKNVLTRLHSECLTGDVFGSLRCDCGEQLQTSLRMIEKEGSGVLLYMRQEGRGIGLLNKIKAYSLQDKGMDTLDANIALGFKGDLREYFIASQILRDLKIESVNLLTNNLDKVFQLEEFGTVVSKRVPIVIPPNEKDLFYLQTKQNRMGHLLDLKK